MTSVRDILDSDELFKKFLEVFPRIEGHPAGETCRMTKLKNGYVDLSVLPAWPMRQGRKDLEYVSCAGDFQFVLTPDGHREIELFVQGPAEKIEHLIDPPEIMEFGQIEYSDSIMKPTPVFNNFVVVWRDGEWLFENERVKEKIEEFLSRLVSDYKLLDYMRGYR